MSGQRKLWKITDEAKRCARPESRVKVYDIYLRNWRGEYQFVLAYPGSYRADEANRRRHVTVWVDNRDGYGFQVHERIDLATWDEASGE
jgi:hypothetical protein